MTSEQVAPNPRTAHLTGFGVVEFRRYLIRERERANFASYFENYFPEAFQQMGAVVFGHFFERHNQAAFTWLRGFENMQARAALNEAFYGGPLWREHGPVMNEHMLDYKNVLLLRPLKPYRELAVLPAVDPVRECAGARGIAVAQIFTLKPGSVDAFARQAERVFAGYRAMGAREAGLLATLDEPNNFPPLPVRTDGPHLLWLGIVRDNDAMVNLQAAAARGAHELSATGLLRGEPELVVLDPARRSRLRWLP